MNVPVLLHIVELERQAVHYRRHRLLRDRLNVLEYYDAVEFKNRFRFEKDNFIRIVEVLHPFISVSRRNASLTSLQQVAVTLRFYATGMFQFSLYICSCMYHTFRIRL